MEIEQERNALRITHLVPALRIQCYEEAVEHYISWLGFHLDWEWRSSPDSPAILSISRDGVTMILKEFENSPGSANLVLDVSDIEALACELNTLRPGSARVVIEPPNDFPSIKVVDSSGNVLVFQQPVSLEVEAIREARKDRMRNYIRQRMALGRRCPTPEEVVAAIGGPLGVVREILCEYPTYAQASSPVD